MRTLFLDCSPKRKNSTSSYLMWHVKVAIKGKKEKMKVLPKNYNAIIEKLSEVDTLVLSMPVYVDGVPGSVLEFLCVVEEKIKEKNLNLKVYVISNCGFYEGKQNRNSLAIIENWCTRCNIKYMGGLGVGAGEMFGIIRFFNVALAFTIAFIQFLVGSIVLLVNKSFTFMGALSYISIINICVNIGLIFVFNTLMYISMAKLSRSIKKERKVANFYTTVLCPRFLFVIFADLFWIIKALVRGVPIWKMYKKNKIEQ